MTSPDRLAQIGEAVQGAIAGTFDAIGPGLAEVPAPDLLDAGDDALAGAETPAVVAHAAPSGDAAGPVVLVLTVAGARRLAAVLGAIDEEEAEVGGGDLGDRELGAVRDATGKLAAAIANAVTGIVDRELAYRPATVRVAEDAAGVRLPVDAGTHAVSASFTLLGEEGRLALLLPAALGASPGSAAAAPAVAPELGEMPLSGALRSVNVRVWAELGRTRMPTGAVVGLPSGAIVELDREAEDAVDLYVDGQRYATGRLVVTDDESWGVRIERVLAPR